MKRILSAIPYALRMAALTVPLVAGWLCGTAVKAWILVKAAFLEGYEAGRKL